VLPRFKCAAATINQKMSVNVMIWTFCHLLRKAFWSENQLLCPAAINVSADKGLVKW
jgi:hypothetical protein